MNKLSVLLVLLAANTQASWAADEIPLGFAWPDGLRATVHQVKSKTKDPGTPGAQTTQVAMTYPMTAARNDKGFVVTFGKLAFEDSLLASMAPAERVQFETMTQAGLPAMQVSPAGEFLAIHDLPLFRATLRAAMLPLAPKGDATLDRFMEQFVSEPLLTGLAANDWGLIVGNWAGNQLEPGATYRASYSAALPLVSGPAIKMVARFTLVRSLPCTRGGVARDCVELEMNTVPDAADMARAIQDWMKALASDATAQVRQPEVKDLDLRTSLRLVTERATLIPHNYTYSKFTRMTVNADGKEQVSAQEEKATVRYSYDGT
ncbi:hypothetical protein LZ009_14440 [Ramlibacter sp. XY19]|uniref:hypothetical protein n=1 Tax=Ramlibacter paludis TaxID=2908000 RepID=UPI0023DA6FC5|nr:hypothetical protein [Ramlibacter paludis]MCG2593977.1 hypothetical protein [Ramlibacter paludis]